MKKTATSLTQNPKAGIRNQRGKIAEKLV